MMTIKYFENGNVAWPFDDVKMAGAECMAFQMAKGNFDIEKFAKRKNYKMTYCKRLMSHLINKGYLRMKTDGSYELYDVAFGWR